MLPCPDLARVGRTRTGEDPLHDPETSVVSSQRRSEVGRRSGRLVVD